MKICQYLIFNLSHMSTFTNAIEEITPDSFKAYTAIKGMHSRIFNTDGVCLSWIMYRGAEDHK